MHAFKNTNRNKIANHVYEHQMLDETYEMIIVNENIIE